MLKFAALLTALTIACASPTIAERIDRSKPIKHEIWQDHRINTVYVSLDKGYAYHEDQFCPTETVLLGLSYTDFIGITEYEAVMRGFFECPDCSNDATSGDFYEVDNISRTVNNIEDIVTDLRDFFIALFSQ